MSKLISPVNGALLYRQMAAAARNQLPFADLFAILAEDPELLGADAPVAALMQQALQEGGGLSDAMARLPDLFAGPTVALVRDAEACGQLAQVLDTLAGEQNDLAQSGSAVRTALLWPSVLLFFSLLIVTAIMIFVVPAFKEVFRSFGADLPAPTQMLIDISDFFVSYWWLIGGAIAALVIAQRRKLLPAFWGLQMERLLLAVPFLRNYVMRAFGARLMRWFALCSKTPTLFEPALRHVHAATNWQVLQGLSAELALRIAAGQSLGQALDRLPPLPRRLGLQVRLGEKTGDIGNALAQAMETAELELAHALLRFERGMFLTAYVMIGLFVGFVVIALYLPIFKLGAVA